MRFSDEAIIQISGGRGGPGSVSFRRECFEPRGGPDGGDGGAGGDVIFRATTQLGSLQDFRFRRVYKAENGRNGSGANKAGKDGENVVIRVPVGTVLTDVMDESVTIDFTEDGQEWVACTGGRGGKGNTHFVSSTHQAPKFAQPGEEGTFREVKLELKLLADIGIIGFPNAGKSTLISRISAARPKIADYAFTTLTPNLGVVQLEDYRSFVVADIPGLVEGAHRGMGLGHKFLKHIERTRLFIHLLDGTQFLEEATRPETFKAKAVGEARETASSFDQAVENLVSRYRAIRTELGLFSETLLHKPEVIVFNKVDALGPDRELLLRAQKRLHDEIASIRGVAPLVGEPYLISAVSGEGLKGLLEVLWERLTDLRIERERANPARAERVLMPNDPAILR